VTKLEQPCVNFESLEEDSLWVTTHYEQLKKHEGKVLAIKGKAIIAISNDVETILLDLEKKKENPANILIEVIPPKNLCFIL
jgi:hypothetical protein